MYLIKKSMQNLLHNKGRNLLLFILLFLVTLAAVVSLTIYNTTKKVKRETENYYAGEVAIVPKEDAGAGDDKRTKAGIEGAPGSDPIFAGLTIDDYKTYINSDYLRSYVFYKQVPVNLEGVQVLDGDYVEQESGEGKRRTSKVKVNALVESLLDERSTDEFTYGDRKVVEGHFPATAEEGMISTELAELNNLKVGDKLRMTDGISGVALELKISGIFSDATVARSNQDVFAPQFNRRNDVIANYDALDQIPNIMLDYKTFLLRDSADLEAFRDELYAKGLPTDLTLQYDTDRYEEAVEGIGEMLVFVKRFFGLVAIVGIGVVFLLNMLALRERKYEIGVLRAIGMSKFKVAALLLCEMLLLALIGSAAAIVAGIFVNPSAMSEMKSITLGGHLPSALMSVIMDLEASFSGLVVVEVIVLSILLVLVAGFMTTASIMRFDPVKILSERT